MGLVLEDDGLARENTIRLRHFSQECIERGRSERSVRPEPAEPLLLDDQQVDRQELLTREVFFLEARDLTNLLADGASLDERLLVHLVDLDEDLRDLTQSQALGVKELLKVAEEQLFVELAEQE